MTVAIAGIVRPAAPAVVQASAADLARRRVRPARGVDPNVAVDPVDLADPAPLAVRAVMVAARSVAMAVRDVVPKASVRRRPRRSPSFSSRFRLKN